MKVRVSAILVLFCFLATIGFAQDSGYQPGKITSVQKREAASASGHTDAPSASSTAAYDMSVESGGKTYNVVYKTHSDLDPTWKEGKDVEIQVKGKAMYMKVNGGKPVKLAIVSSK
jgi:hypothetical protein